MRKEKNHFLPELYAVRHGQTTANVNEQLDRNPQLTSVGVMQAVDTGRKLSHTRPLAIIHTGLDRTRETARVIKQEGEFNNVPLIEHRGFREREMGIYEGVKAFENIRSLQGMEELFQQYGNSCVWFVKGSIYDQVEPLRKMQQRIRDGLFQIQELYGGNPIILVAHEGSIKIIKAFYHGDDPTAEFLADSRNKIANGEITYFSQRRGR